MLRSEAQNGLYCHRIIVTPSMMLKRYLLKPCLAMTRRAFKNVAIFERSALKVEGIRQVLCSLLSSCPSVPNPLFYILYHTGLGFHKLDFSFTSWLSTRFVKKSFWRGKGSGQKGERTFFGFARRSCHTTSAAGFSLCVL